MSGVQRLKHWSLYYKVSDMLYPGISGRRELTAGLCDPIEEDWKFVYTQSARDGACGWMGHHALLQATADRAWATEKPRQPLQCRPSSAGSISVSPSQQFAIWLNRNSTQISTEDRRERKASLARFRDRCLIMFWAGTSPEAWMPDHCRPKLTLYLGSSNAI